MEVHTEKCAKNGTIFIEKYNAWKALLEEEEEEEADGHVNEHVFVFCSHNSTNCIGKCHFFPHKKTDYLMCS